ncbi:GNAT family N-acetyltransferase [Amycolatopsis sp. NPDC004368]
MIDILPQPAFETSEAEALFHLVGGAPAGVRELLGITSTRLGGAVVLGMRHDPTDYWSRAVGFGRTEPVTAGLITEICTFFRAAGVRQASFQLAPSVLPADWADICAREGLKTSSAIAKHVAPVADVVARADDPAREQPDGIRVAPLEPGDTQRWAALMMDIFGMPREGFGEMFEASAADPNCHPYAAWLGDELVGTALLYRQGEIAQLFSGAVAEHARSRGGQSELIAARARLAAQLGCRWVVSETDAPGEGEHNTSQHNLLDLGFQLAYERPNWTWRSAG